MTSSSPGRAQRTALRSRCPLSRAGKEIIFDDDTIDVGVDAVLSADVGDAPMRQRQYTARVEAPFCVVRRMRREKDYPSVSRSAF
jgi:hypothetical protein